MRCNPRVYSLGDSYEPFERQEFDGRIVDVYFMNNILEIYNQHIPTGRFAVWSSVDGFNYRLFIEEGFYNEMKALYQPKVNKIWLDYWDRVDKYTRTVNFKILLPIAILLIGILVLLSVFIKNEKVSMIVQIVALVGFLIGMFTTNSYSKRKTMTFHHEAMNDIKKAVGSKNFDTLIDKQKTYIDDYLEAKAKEAEALYREEEGLQAENSEVVSEQVTLEEAKEEGTLEPKEESTLTEVLEVKDDSSSENNESKESE